jgi:5-methylthioribose kinase
MGFKKTELKLISYNSYIFKEQEVLGRTIRLLSFDTTRKHRKRRVQEFFYCCLCILCRGNVFTEPLTSNDEGDRNTDTEKVISQAYYYFFKIGKVC